MSRRLAPSVKQERDAIAGRLVVKLASAALLVALLAVVGQRCLLGTVRPPLSGPPSALRLASPVAPRTIGVVEQTSAVQAEDGLATNRAAERSLHETAWVDRNHRVARFPIERSMALYVERHAHDAGVTP